MGYKDPEKKRAYQLRWVAANWKRWIEENGPCAHCGSKEGLQVDHVESGNKVGHRIWSWSEKRRSKELKKCQVLCASCHQKKTEKNLEGMYKLPREQVEEIRSLYTSGDFSLRALASRYKIGKTQVWRIVTRQQRK